MIPAEITATHRARRAAVYVRQSTLTQVAENLESQRRQYGLVERAVELGWHRNDVLMIDDDLGVSGAGGPRKGFDRLVAEVGLGHVGIIFAIEVSRLARNNRDWYHLLDLCALVDTVIADADGLYHPSVFNDRLLLGLKGTMSEVELHLIRSRMSGGLWEAARRGELRTHLPVGYEYDNRGAIVMCQDEAVRETIGLVFRKFAQLGSARQVVAHLADTGVPLPHRDLRDNQVSWRRATYAPVHRMLTNPTYAGVYAYGRSTVQHGLDEEGHLTTRVVWRKAPDWKVLIEDHHAGFITYETFSANLERLRTNWRASRGENGGAVREGAALLQGLIRCGRCGRRMQVTYSGPGGRTRRYACHQAVRLQAAERSCQHLGGVRLDRTVADAFLAALAPASLEATLTALRETEQVWAAERKQRELVVEQARYVAERAKRQFDRVEPENRLVTRSLEHEWEQRLATVAVREEELARFKVSRPAPLSDEEIAWLRAAGADLKSIWNAESTTHRERKQLLRCLVKQTVVTVHRERAEADVTIVWAGGATTRLTSKLNRTGEHHRVTSAEVINLVQRLVPDHTDEQVAFVLNRKRLLTAHGKTFNARRVANVRQRLGLPAAIPTRVRDDGDPQWMDVGAAASTLRVSRDTVCRWAREGFLEARQAVPASPWRVRVTDEVRQRVVPDAPPGWVGLAAAAQALGRSKQTVLQRVQSGRLRAVQVTSGQRKGLRIELEKEPVGLFAGQ